MNLTDFTFFNIFDYGKEYTLTVPSNSEKILILCQELYDKILDFFSDDKNKDEYDIAYSLLEEYIKDFKRDTIVYEADHLISFNTNKEYIDKLKELNSSNERVNNILLGKDSENKNILFSIFYFMLYFSFFEFNDESYLGQYGEDIVSSYVFKEFKPKQYSYEGKCYKLNKENKTFFYFVEKCYSSSWTDKECWFYSRTGETKTIKLYDLVTEGYYKTEDELVFFDALPTNMNYFVINSLLFNNTNFEFLTPIGDKYRGLNIGVAIYEYFYKGILEVITERMTKTESGEDVDSFSLDINDNEIIVRSGDDFVKFYAWLYNIVLYKLEKEVERIKKENKDDASQEIKDSETIAKLINILVKIKEPGNNLSIEFDENFDYKLDIYDYKRKGYEIADAILPDNYKLIESYGEIGLGSKTKSIKGTQQPKIENENEYLLPNGTIEYNKFNYDSVIKWNKGFSVIYGTIWENKKTGNNSGPVSIQEQLYKCLNNSFYFYEDFLFNYKGLTQDNISIDELEKISGNVLFKLSLFLFYKLWLDTNNQYISFKKGKEIRYSGTREYYTSTNIDCSTFFIKKRFSSPTAKQVTINEQYFYTVKEVYEYLGQQVVEVIKNILNIKISEAEATEHGENVELNNKSFNDYVKQRLSGKYYTEKDYFYIGAQNEKRLPNNSFIDIDFKILEYDENGKNPVETWVPVTSIRKERDGEIDEMHFNTSQEARHVHAGTYFDSMELTDKGGTKEINLVLKSPNDINLEQIIFNSLSSDNRSALLEASKKDVNNIFDELDKLILCSDSNFRVRFGYRDISKNDNENNPTVITTSNSDDDNFLNRTKGEPLPVEIYPWTYFKITNLSSEIIEGEDRYTIKGVSSGSYLLNNFTICGVPKNFSDTSDKEDFLGRPKNVIGKIAKWTMEASSKSKDSSNIKNLETARICFLGDKDGTIINDVIWDDSERANIFKSEYSYKLKNGGTFKGGNIESIENCFFDSASGKGESSNKLLSAKNFYLKTDARTLSIKEILENLTQWLPSRVYYIGKFGEAENEKTAAIWLPYDSIYRMGNFFETCPFKSERLKYQIIEADAQIYKTGTQSSKNEYQKTYFIRMYYEGPGMSVKYEGDATGKNEAEEADEYLRIYNYRSLEQQVIENISISSPDDSEFGQIISSVSLLGSGQSLVYSFDKENGTLNSDCVSLVNSKTKSDKTTFATAEATIDEGKTWGYMNDPSENFKPYLSLNNSKYIFLNSQTIEPSKFPNTESAFREEATKFFTDLQNKQYVGEMTILGDPFYYFDSSLTPAKYEIFLQMNRSKDYKTYEGISSRYTGIYYITGIKHSIDTEGKFRTTLSITKRLFTNNDSKEEKSDDSKKEE